MVETTKDEDLSKIIATLIGSIKRLTRAIKKNNDLLLQEKLNKIKRAGATRHNGKGVS